MIVDKEYREQREEFIARFVREYPEHPIPDSISFAREILELSQTLQNVAVTECNQELTDLQRDRADSCERKLRQLVMTKLVGTTVNTMGDPRGSVVKLLVPSGYYDSWGGAEDGWCVPTNER